MRRNWKQWKILFSWAPRSLQMVTAGMILKDACSLEAKLWQTYSILKSRDITLLIKVCLVKTMVFPVVMCGCESWTINEAENQRIDVSELWCWRRLLWCWREVSEYWVFTQHGKVFYKRNWMKNGMCVVWSIQNTEEQNTNKNLPESYHPEMTTQHLFCSPCGKNTGVDCHSLL